MKGTYHYSLLQRTTAGQLVTVCETRVTFPPEHEQGKAVISSLFDSVQRMGRKGEYGVSMQDGKGGQLWFNRQGQAVEEENAFA